MLIRMTGIMLIITTSLTRIAQGTTSDKYNSSTVTEQLPLTTKTTVPTQTSQTAMATSEEITSIGHFSTTSLDGSKTISSPQSSISTIESSNTVKNSAITPAPVINTHMVKPIDKRKSPIRKELEPSTEPSSKTIGIHKRTSSGQMSTANLNGSNTTLRQMTTSTIESTTTLTNSTGTTPKPVKKSRLAAILGIFFGGVVFLYLLHLAYKRCKRIKATRNQQEVEATQSHSAVLAGQSESLESAVNGNPMYRSIWGGSLSSPKSVSAAWDPEVGDGQSTPHTFRAPSVSSHLKYLLHQALPSKFSSYHTKVQKISPKRSRQKSTPTSPDAIEAKNRSAFAGRAVSEDRSVDATKKPAVLEAEEESDSTKEKLSTNTT